MHTKLKRPYIIGLTGNIGSGKSTCSRILAEKFNIPIVDADAIAYKVCQPGAEGLKAIEENFGSEYILENGEYNRALMSKTVTEDEKALERLNNLLHPIIKKEKDRQLKALKDSPLIIYDCPLLFEAGEDTTVDEILLVTTNEEERLKRLIERDKIDENEAVKRLQIQESDLEKLSKSDFIIYNNGSIEKLEKSIEQYLDLKFEELENKKIKKS